MEVILVFGVIVILLVIVVVLVGKVIDLNSELRGEILRERCIAARAEQAERTAATRLTLLQSLLADHREGR